MLQKTRLRSCTVCDGASCWLFKIELPGHSQAALASYSWLGCTGEKLEVANKWGVFKDIYCAGNDSTLEFIETVMDEVCDLFPSNRIHIGGDEAPKSEMEDLR